LKSFSLQPSTFNLKRGVQLGKIGRNLNHGEVILPSVYHARMNDIQLKTT
jgi:hypothetical protein